MKNKIYLIPAMTLPLLASIFYFNFFDGEEIVKYIYLAAKVFTFAYPLFFLAKTVSLKTAFRFDVKELAIGAVLGVTLFVSGWLVLRIDWVGAIINEGAPFVRAKMVNFGVLEHFLVMAFVISFIHSMLEEYYWRWFVFGASRLNVTSAIAFSLHHYVIVSYYFSWPVALVFTSFVATGGVIFNFLYARKNNVWGAWAMHVGADLLIFYTGYVLLNGGF